MEARGLRRSWEMLPIRSRRIRLGKADLLHVRLDRGRHLVEAPPERAQLVAALHRHAAREVALLESRARRRSAT